MTNTVNSVTLAIVWLVCATNWTGHRVGTNELGYVATNHVLRCEYQGVKYDFTLKTEPGAVAVWRPEGINLSNIPWTWYTNLWFQNPTSNSRQEMDRARNASNLPQ